MNSRKNSLLALRDREAKRPVSEADAMIQSPKQATGAPSRQGKKAMTGYFSPEMSFAMHVTSRKHGLTLQDAMGEAFNDWLRKMGESPVGK